MTPDAVPGYKSQRCGAGNPAQRRKREGASRAAAAEPARDVGGRPVPAGDDRNAAPLSAARAAVARAGTEEGR